MTALVSVVITTVGNEYVYRSIEKVLNQSYKNIEILVMYDGDNFEKFKMDFEGKEYITAKLFNVGPFNNANHARNRGIELSKGNYVALLDDDDFWDVDHIENLVNYSKKISNDRVLLITGSKVYSEKKGVIKKTPAKTYLNNRRDISKILFCENGFMQTSSYFFTKKLGEDIKFDENLRMHQDYDWLIKIQNSDLDIYVKQLNIYTNYYSTDANNGSISKKSKINCSVKWCLKNIKDTYIRYCFLKNVTCNFTASSSFKDLINFYSLVFFRLDIGLSCKIVVVLKSIRLFIKSFLKNVFK